MFHKCYTLCVVLLVAGGPALAQIPGETGGPASLLWLEKVQKELKLSDDQITKGKDILTKVREKHQDELTKLQSLDEKDRAVKARELRKKMSDETNKELAQVLKPDQLKRLKQINLQVLGVQAFRNTSVRKALKITDDQNKKLTDEADKSVKEIRQLLEKKAGNFNEASEQITQIRNESMSKALALLKDDQKKAWHTLTGKPLEIRLEELFGLK